MEQMRSEFLNWLPPSWDTSMFTDDDGDVQFVDEWVQGAWIGWQASRAAIEIELPKNKWHPCDCIDVVVAYDKDDIDQCIRAAGLRVKAP